MEKKTEQGTKKLVEEYLSTLDGKGLSNTQFEELAANSFSHYLKDIFKERQKSLDEKLLNAVKSADLQSVKESLHQGADVFSKIEGQKMPFDLCFSQNYLNKEQSKDAITTKNEIRENIFQTALEKFKGSPYDLTYHLIKTNKVHTLTPEMIKPLKLSNIDSSLPKALYHSLCEGKYKAAETFIGLGANPLTLPEVEKMAPDLKNLLDTSKANWIQNEMSRNGAALTLYKYLNLKVLTPEILGKVNISEKEVNTTVYKDYLINYAIKGCDNGIIKEFLKKGASLNVCGEGFNGLEPSIPFLNANRYGVNLNQLVKEASIELQAQPVSVGNNLLKTDKQKTNLTLEK